jgi:hypothetical protein
MSCTSMGRRQAADRDLESIFSQTNAVVERWFMGRKILEIQVTEDFVETVHRKEL